MCIRDRGRPAADIQLVYPGEEGSRHGIGFFGRRQPCGKAQKGIGGKPLAQGMGDEGEAGVIPADKQNTFHKDPRDWKGFLSYSILRIFPSVTPLAGEA